MSIPRIAHFYWGEKNMSFLRFATIKSFAEMNPDWDIRIYRPNTYCSKKTWTTKEHKFDIDIKEDYYNKIDKEMWNNVSFNEFGFNDDTPEVIKSDFFRYYILHKYGGMWADMDIVFFKPMDFLFGMSGNEPSTYVCYNGRYYSIGVLLSSMNNPLFKLLHNKSIDMNIKKKTTEYQSIGSSLWGNVFKDFDDISRIDNVKKIYNIPMDIFYAYDSTKINMIFQSNDMSLFSDRSIGLHWYGGSSVTKLPQETLVENNYYDSNTVISNVLKKTFRRA